MNKQININRVAGKVVFDFVSVTQNDSVFWTNNDPQEAHWPVWKMSLNKLGPAPSPNSSFCPAYPQAVPTTMVYGCAIHDNEQGSFDVYATFAPGSTPAATVGTVYTANVATGGMSPYTVGQVAGQLPPGLSLAGTPNNRGITLSGTPKEVGTFTFTLVQASDNLQNVISQVPFKVTVNARKP